MFCNEKEVTKIIKSAFIVNPDEKPVRVRSSAITKTRLFKYIENFTNKAWKFSDKNMIFFYISTQNIDCRYSSEPPCRGRNKKNNVYPVNPSFTIKKSGV